MSHDDPFENLQREIQRLFHDLVYHRHPISHFSEPTWSPAADLVVTEHGARVLIELAGVPHDQVRVRLRGRVLEVSGRRQSPARPQGSHFHRAEIYFGDFRRVVELPWTADDSQVDAKYRDGMLEILLVPAPEPERTDVTVGSHVSRTSER